MRIEATFFLVTAILGQARPGGLVLAWIAVVFVSILAHELGHAFAFRAFGDDPRITLHALGGLTHSTKALPLAKDLATSVAGSLTGLLLLGIPAYAVRAALDPLASGDLTVWVILSDLVWVNLWWSLLNLLPILPLDGGLVARRLLLHTLGHRGERAALVLSIAVAGVGAAFALAAGFPFLVIYASLFVARDGWHLWRRRDDTSRERIREARRLLEGGQRARAQEILERTSSDASTPSVREEAASPLAWSLLEDGRFSDAKDVIEGPASWTGMAVIVGGVLHVLDGSVADGAQMVAVWWLANPRHSLGDMIVGHLARCGAVPAVVDQLLAAEGDEAGAHVAVLQAELHFGGDYLLAAEVGRRLFEDGRIRPDLAAFNVACSLTRDGHLGQALDWLDRAVQSGWTDERQILEDVDLIPLQDLPRFGVILGRIPRHAVKDEGS